MKREKLFLPCIKYSVILNVNLIGKILSPPFKRTLQPTFLLVGENRY